MDISTQLHAPNAFFPWREIPRHPVDRRVGGPDSRFNTTIGLSIWLSFESFISYLMKFVVIEKKRK
jgi:hypothetical protein